MDDITISRNSDFMTQKDNSRRSFLIKLAAGGTAVAGMGSLGLVLYKDQTWVESEPYERTSEGAASAAVVVYSRSGNTLLAAKELARLHDADLFVLQAPAYPQTFSGQMRASDDASNERRKTKVIQPTIDFGRYSRVILCSPTWWYRPAVPMWAFAASQNFLHSEVFLLMTGNSSYQASKIEEFGELVQASNGRFTGYHFIERGRVFWQISAEELRQQVKRQFHSVS